MGDRLDAPSLPLAVAGVHPVKLGGEERRLVAAGAGADLHDGGAVVERIMGDEERLEPTLGVLYRFDETLLFGARLGGQLGVVRIHELARLRQVVLVLPEAARQLDYGR
jgi:hypothetical protein